MINYMSEQIAGVHLSSEEERYDNGVGDPEKAEFFRESALSERAVSTRWGVFHLPGDGRWKRMRVDKLARTELSTWRFVDV